MMKVSADYIAEVNSVTLEEARAVLSYVDSLAKKTPLTLAEVVSATQVEPGHVKKVLFCLWLAHHIGATFTMMHLPCGTRLGSEVTSFYDGLADAAKGEYGACPTCGVTIRGVEGEDVSAYVNFRR